MNKTYTSNIGALFKNEHRKTEKSPLLTGTIDLDRTLVTYLIEQLRAGQRARITIGGWKNISSKTGKKYFTIKASPEYKPKDSELPLDDQEDDGLDL